MKKETVIDSPKINVFNVWGGLSGVLFGAWRRKNRSEQAQKCLRFDCLFKEIESAVYLDVKLSISSEA